MSTTTTHHAADYHRISEEIRDLGMADAKGRAIGAQVTIYEATVAESATKTWHELEPLPVGTVVRWVRIWTARDGRSFGAIPRTYFAGDVASGAQERIDAEIARRLEGMRKRYARVLK